MEEVVHIDLRQATLRAEEMLTGMTVESINLYDFATAVALIIRTMSKEYEVDNMLLIQQIENIAVQIDEEE